jgi:hypothetical protein
MPKHLFAFLETHNKKDLVSRNALTQCLILLVISFQEMRFDPPKPARNSHDALRGAGVRRSLPVGSVLI